MPDELGQWTVSGCEAELSRRRLAGRKRSTRTLILKPSEQKREVRIPGKFAPSTFDQLVLTMISARGETRVRADFTRRGRSIVSTPLYEHEKRANNPLPLVVLDIPNSRRVRMVADELVLSFSPGEEIIELAYIDLLHQPIAARYPDPANGPALISAMSEHRRGWALLSMSPLEGTFRAPENGTFSFSYALPEEARLRSVEPVLRLSLTGDRGARFATDYSLEKDLEEPARWHSASIALDEFEGQEVHVQYELTGYTSENGMCAVTQAEVSVPHDDPQTVLLITSDTHRADHLGIANSTIQVETPTIDALAARGIYFESCFASSNITNPSHIGILTGTHMRDFLIFDNLHPITDAAVTLAERFHEAGFVTFAAVSAPHLAPEFSGLGQGFDRFATTDRSKRDAHETIAFLEDWMREADGRPLFVWLHLFDAHAPYLPPDDFDRYYYPKDRDPLDPVHGPLNVPEGQIPNWIRGLQDIDFPNRQYAAEVSYLDDQVGRLLQNARLRNGILCLTADHGESLTEHGIYWNHTELYPVSLHVPLILTYPGGPVGVRIENQIDNLSIGRTLLDLAGLAEVEFPGTNLVEGVSSERGDAPCFALAANRTAASVTYQGWHLMLHLRGHRVDSGSIMGMIPMHTIQLYDLEEDPECVENLADIRPDKTRELRDLLVAWMLDSRDLGWSGAATQNAALADQLAQLGYAEALEKNSSWQWIDPDCPCKRCAKLEPVTSGGD